MDIVFQFLTMWMIKRSEEKEVSNCSREAIASCLSFLFANIFWVYWEHFSECSLNLPIYAWRMISRFVLSHIDSCLHLQSYADFDASSISSWSLKLFFSSVHVMSLWCTASSKATVLSLAVSMLSWHGEALVLDGAANKRSVARR